MSVLRPRNRSIYYRVSDDEFSALENLCREGHARSISELSREAVLRYLQGIRRPQPEPVEGMEKKLQAFERMVAELQGRLVELQSLAKKPPGSGAVIRINGQSVQNE